MSQSSHRMNSRWFRNRTNVKVFMTNVIENEVICEKIEEIREIREEQEAYESDVEYGDYDYDYDLLAEDVLTHDELVDLCWEDSKWWDSKNLEV